MRTFRSTLLLGILAILVLAPSCSKSSKGGGQLPALVAVLLWNTPIAQYMVPRKASLPRTLETLVLEHTGSAGDVRYELDDPTGSLRATPASGVLRPGQQIAITIDVIKLIAYTTVTMHMALSYVDDTTVGPLNAALLFSLMPPGMFVMAVISGDSNVASLFLAAIVFGLIGVIVLHSTNDPLRNRVPALAFTEIVLIGLVTIGLSLQHLQANFWRNKNSQESNVEVNFPPGEGPIGYTIHPKMEVDMTEGDYRMFHMMLRDPHPIVDPDTKNIHTYAFVMDTDGDAANNWKPSILFPNDFWKDTDRWYQIDYNNQDGWSFTVSQVDALNNVKEVASAARMIIVDDAIVLVVPKSEIPGPGAKWRSSSFVHVGDFGFNPPYIWSGDVEPAVAKPLVDIK